MTLILQVYIKQKNALAILKFDVLATKISD